VRHRIARLSVASATLLVFVVLWVTIAARPWATPSRRTPDPRIVALQARQRALKRETAHVNVVVTARWHRYRQALRKREQEIAAAKQRHDEQLAAARSAYARLAAYRARAAAPSSARTVTTTVASRTTSTPSAPAAPASAPVPPSPPPVQVVTLPPVTGTSSSRKP